jgi:hypothetical protein
MKKIYIAQTIIVIVLSSLSCLDNVRLSEDELKSYSWLSPFINESYFSEFQGYINIDNGSIYFTVKTSSLSLQDLTEKFDSIAVAQEWSKKYDSNHTLSYSKYIPRYDLDQDTTCLSIDIETISERINFSIESSKINP